MWTIQNYVISNTQALHHFHCNVWKLSSGSWNCVVSCVVTNVLVQHSEGLLFTPPRLTKQTAECEGRYKTNGKGGEIGSQKFVYMIQYGFISHQKI
jgi:hypothetical protein